IPSQGKLQLATSITYRVEYRNDQSPSTIPTLRQKELFGEIVKAMVVNPEDVSSFAPDIGIRWSPALVPPGYYEYVIISESPMDTVFERFADWKTRKGIPATVVTVSWINSTYTGYDLQEEIRNFIIDAYNSWGTIYILLGGSGDQKTGGQNIVPARRTWHRTCGVGYYPDENWIPNDLYYSDLDGNWDADGDNTYGEIPDDVDMYADVYVGRASVYSVSMAQNFVYKVLTYEKNPPTGYIKKNLLPTAILWSSYEERFMQNKIADITPAGWFDAKLYEREGTLSRVGMIDSMNVGYGMGHWVGHGNENGMYMGSPYLTSGDADALVNGDKVGIANSIACFTGAWDETPGGDCFAEHLVNRVGGGLLAAMMNSRYGWGAYVGGYVPGPSERLDTTFYYNVFISNIYHLGEAHAVAKDAWVPYADMGNQYDFTRWCIYELNLLGCPEIPIWTDEPASLIVTHDATVSGPVSFSVSVSDDSKAPVSNALVCLWCKLENTMWERGYTDASGNVSILVNPTMDSDTMWVTVTKHNYIPYEGYATVTEVSINLTEFSANAFIGNVKINWRTENESDNVCWIIERAYSEDINWEQIGTVPGQGTKPNPTEYLFIDAGIEQDGKYFYRLISVDSDGKKLTFGPVSEMVRGNVPCVTALHDIFPNPCLGKLSVFYNIPKRSFVKLCIYNSVGQVVRALVNGKLEPGYHSVTWDGKNDRGAEVGNGIYFLRMNAENFKIIKKILLVK
ncbi:T9SS type A sorting domain-containing protein, partial [candidate division WOR-3 bacterium]|nr:T9SS type A sorting domain-containing protein [candidate division WOR-3 bacterium]